MLAALQLTIGFLLTIFIIVGVHEYGHYLAARFFGLKIVRFSIGLGKPLLRRVDRHGTEWVLAPWPIGGYLQMVQTIEEAQSMQLDERKSFAGIARWQRSIIVAAGPLANFVLAALLFFVAAIYGTEGLRARIGEVIADTPAAAAGFAAGHDIVAIDGREVVLWSEAYESMFTSVAHRDLAVEVVDSGGARRDLQLLLTQLPPAVLEDGNVLEKIGLRPDESYLSVVLETVVADSPAAVAGLQADDAIVAINGSKVSSWRAIVAAIEASPAEPMQIIVLRGDEQLEFEAVPRAQEEGGRSVGKLGVAPKIDRPRLESLLVHRRASIGEALASGWHRTGEAVLLT
ncbi:MAG: RIP metalloprotease RseP, partial [Betaproteobacteria bacterium]|nr:RIP metalloprotease RseP [Betaproteobacteria bacterium]